MTRQDAYAYIKLYGLQEEVKNKYGRNFTQVATAELEKLIQAYEANTAGTQSSCNCENKQVNEVANPYEAACLAFVGLLKDADLLEGILAKL